jgi:hypothetical protein
MNATPAASSAAARVDGVFIALPGVAEPSADVLETLLYAAAERRDAAARSALEKGLSAVPPAQSLASAARGARLLWDAHAFTGEPRWREAAAAATERILSDLRDPALQTADANALSALALLRASAFGVAGAFDAAGRALAFIQTRLYDPLLGLVHKQGGDAHGLLGDAAWTALACTEAFLSAGAKPHREFADALMRFLFQELWERERGGFVERAARAGETAVPRVDPALNSVALEACWRLHHLKGNMNYRRWVDWGLNGAWPAAGGDAANLAGLARVADMAARGRADFELVGRLPEPKAQALLRSLRRRYAPRAIVSFVDPDDQDYIMAHKLEADAYPRLFGCGKDLRRLADACEPDLVGGVISAVRAAEAE